MADKNYCIFRVDKVKSTRSVVSLLKEHQRADGYDHKRADPELLPRDFFSGTWETCLANFQAKLPPKNRKNAVYALDILVSSSREFQDPAEEKKFYEAAEKFLNENLGQVFASAIHRDETSTHAHFMTIPLVNGRLNARELCGGTRQKMAALQTRFWEEVGKPFGLERGEKNSKSLHKTVERKHAEEEAALRERAASLASAEKAIQAHEDALQSQQKALDEKSIDIDDKVRLLQSWKDSASEKSLEILKTCKKAAADPLYTPASFQGFSQKVAEALTGAWKAVSDLLKNYERLEKELQEFKKMTPKQFGAWYEQQKKVRGRH